MGPRSPAPLKAAVVAVIRRGGRVLVIRRGPRARRPGYWAPPSGAVEAGETQAEAVVRETLEETGLCVRPLAKVWECDTDDGQFRLYWWTAEPLSEALRLEPGEASEARWVDADAFARLQPTFERHRHFFASVLSALD
jgi:8-oxo-dGTP diphosphatase